MDNVPAELQDRYKEVEGKFVLEFDDDVKTHPSAAALSNAYRQEEAKRRDLATKLLAANARLDGLPNDFDAEKYEAFREQADTHHRVASAARRSRSASFLMVRLSCKVFGIDARTALSTRSSAGDGFRYRTWREI